MLLIHDTNEVVILMTTVLLPELFSYLNKAIISRIEFG